MCIVYAHYQKWYFSSNFVLGLNECFWVHMVLFHPWRDLPLSYEFLKFNLIVKRKWVISFATPDFFYTQSSIFADGLYVIRKNTQLENINAHTSTTSHVIFRNWASLWRLRSMCTPLEIHWGHTSNSHVACTVGLNKSCNPTMKSFKIFLFNIFLRKFYQNYPIKSIALWNLNQHIKFQYPKIGTPFLVNYFIYFSRLYILINWKINVMILKKLIAHVFWKHHCPHLSYYKNSHCVGKIFLYVTLMSLVIFFQTHSRQRKRSSCITQRFEQK